ncbi:MAG: M61 family metallopeptidase, partial [Flavisolibacter sp.]
MQRFLILILVFAFHFTHAQNPYKHFNEATEIRYDSRQPVVNYTIRVDSNDLSQFKVEMQLRTIPDTLRLAMFVHPEYDDRFYRYVEAIEVKTKYGKGSISRLENTLWKLNVEGGEALINYTIRLPKPESQRAAWGPFLSQAGGLIGGPQSYLYVVGSTLAPSYVHLDFPKTWSIVTGLSPTSDPHIFFAPTVNALIDAPIFAGEIKEWRFITDGVPHRAVYWPAKNAASVDSTDLINSIQKITEQALKLFGRLPYREYS